MGSKHHSLSWVIVLSITGAGIVLQSLWGSLDLSIFIFPIHSIAFLGIFVFALCSTLFLKKWRVVKFLSGGYAAISSIVALAVWALVLGLTAQFKSVENQHDWASLSGIRQMTSFWPFLLSYLYLMLCLAFATSKRLWCKWNIKNIGFFFNHAGLLLLLYFAGIASADVNQYSMIVQEKSTEWRAEDSKGQVVELPIAIELDDFIMEEYNPKLAVVDRRDGKVQGRKEPEYFDIDTANRKGRLLHWEINLQKYLPHAVRTSDSTYQALQMPGTCPACFITVTHLESGEQKSSWVSSGNQMQLYKFLPLHDSLCIAMTQAEPKAFYSDVQVYLKDGQKAKTRIAVNAPLSIDHWMIYQTDYDKSLGSSSITSVFDLVYNPWTRWEYASSLLLAIGACFLFFGTHHHKQKKK